MNQSANPARLTLEELFAREVVDGIFIKNLTSIRYLTGFSGSTALLYVGANGRRRLYVDSRYITQAKQECRGCEAVLVKLPLLDFGTDVLALGCKRLGFEARELSYSEHYALTKHIGGDCALVPFDDNLALIRCLKTPDEIAKIRAACRMAHQAYEGFLTALRSGMTELEAAWELDRRFRELGAKGNSFDSIVVFGERSALVHGHPADRRLREGDAVLVDRGLYLDGYASDETTTVFFGSAPAKLRELYAIVKEAHDRCLEAVRPGVACRDLDALARDVIVKAGYGDFFGHSTGHGIGLDVHECPYISPRGEGRVEEGMVFSIEPGIYLPDQGGVRIEDLVAVTATGAEVLTLADKTLTVLPLACNA